MDMRGYIITSVANFFQPEQINQSACDIAWEVATAKKTLVAGGITQTKSYTYQVGGRFCFDFAYFVLF